MNILHCLDNLNLGGIQEMVYRLFLHSLDHHAWWAADGSFSPELRRAGMVIWNGGPPREAQYDICVGHTVGGWSYRDTFLWAKERGMKTVECMHSNARSPTPPDLVDAFVALNHIALHLNPHMARRQVIYGIADVGAARRNAQGSIGRLSRLVDEKRPQDFLALANRFPSENFVLAGHGPLYHQISVMASGNLTLLGQVRDFASFYSGLKLFVFPTRDECCCISVAMAQMAQVPVLCQDIPPLRETTGGHAQFASTDDQFARGIETFLDNPQPYWEVADQGWEWAKQNFSPSVVVDQWGALCRQLTN